MFTVMAVAAAAGEAGKAALGMLLSDPDVTGPRSSRCCPPRSCTTCCSRRSCSCSSPGSPARRPERAPAPEFSDAQRLAPVFRAASYGAAPDLRLRRHRGELPRAAAARRVPRLRLSDGRAGSSASTYAAAPGGAAVPLAGGRTPRLSFGGDLPARTGLVRTGSRPRAWARTGCAARPVPRSRDRRPSGRTRRPRGGHRAARAAAGSRRRAWPGWPGRQRGARRVTRAPAGQPARGRARARRGTGRDGAEPRARPGEGLDHGGEPGRAGARAVRGPGNRWIMAGSLACASGRRVSRAPGKRWITAGSLARPSGHEADAVLVRAGISAGSLARPSGRRVSRAPGKGWITAARTGGLAGRAARRPARGPGRGWLRGRPSRRARWRRGPERPARRGGRPRRAVGPVWPVGHWPAAGRRWPPARRGSRRAAAG